VVGSPGEVEAERGTAVEADCEAAGLGEGTDRGEGADFEKDPALGEETALDEGVNLGDATGFGEKLGLSKSCSALSTNLERRLALSGLDCLLSAKLLFPTVVLTEGEVATSVASSAAWLKDGFCKGVLGEGLASVCSLVTACS
jgi:hypothetical protein